MKKWTVWYLPDCDMFLLRATVYTYMVEIWIKWYRGGHVGGTNFYEQSNPVTVEMDESYYNEVKVMFSCMAMSWYSICT